VRSEALWIRLDRAQSEAEGAQAVLDQPLRRFFVPEDARNAFELLEKGDRVRERAFYGTTGR
jgi:hypothetical protein